MEQPGAATTSPQPLSVASVANVVQEGTGMLGWALTSLSKKVRHFRYGCLVSTLIYIFPQQIYGDGQISSSSQVRWYSRQTGRQIAT
jgi:hypothetical protein